MENEIDIPKALCSSDTGAPFDRCMVCDKYLLEEGTSYFIEKSIRQHPGMQAREVIFEYAVCLHCSLVMSESLSEESRKRVSEYLMRNAQFESRRDRLSNLESLSIDHWIDRCLIKDTPIADAPEYQIVAQCSGGKLQLQETPFALSLEAMDELAELLSEQSRREMDDFIDTHFSGPPELADILRKRPPVLI